ncbi:bdellin B-3-like [Ostrinia furnacalis]|uniref:bdellin B-3-like n=1 Tax=Ostrinia furnacalis TaxID=93504 RepID=UPI00103E200A|nr:bdellin B-3-like [Ostrinia furnacalis]
MKLFYYALTVLLLIVNLMAVNACVCVYLEYDPVCATNGVTYDSDCYLDCAATELKHRGPCEGHTVFSAEDFYG